jgi:hypothetical protein
MKIAVISSDNTVLIYENNILNGLYTEYFNSNREAYGDAFEDIIKFVMTSTGCDEKMATDLVFEVEGQLCMDEERDYYDGQEVIYPDENDVV